MGKPGEERKEGEEAGRGGIRGCDGGRRGSEVKKKGRGRGRG
jgi:hypothetical protein